MSGVQTLVEIVMSLSPKRRPAWRALPEARDLDALIALPASEARVELTENTKNVRVVALFEVEAEARAEQLVGAFRAAAPLGATGEGTCLVLVDFQRDAGTALTLGDGTSSVAPLPERKARARHRVLDAFLEKCMAPPPAPRPPSDPALEAAFRAALVKAQALSAEELGAAFAHVKATTLTNAGFAVTKKQEQQLLPLLEAPPDHWTWAKVLPLRLMFPREPATTEAVVLDLLDGAELAQDERWMLLESLADSTTDVALERLRVALSGEHFLAAVARRALAASVHPRATSTIVSLAEDWLARALANPDLLPGARAVFIPGAPPNEPMDLMSLLGMRGDERCDAMLLRIWRALYDARARLTQDAASVAVLAAQTYVASRGRLVDPGALQPLLLKFPHMFVPLEQASAALDELHRMVPAPVR